MKSGNRVACPRVGLLSCNEIASAIKAHCTRITTIVCFDSKELTAGNIIPSVKGTLGHSFNNVFTNVQMAFV